MENKAHKPKTDPAGRMLQQWKTLITYPNFILCVLIYGLLYCYVDKPLAVACHRHPFFSWAKPLGFLGQGFLYMVIFAIIAIYFWVIGQKIWARRMAWMCAWVSTAYLLCGALKVILGRARPVEWFTHHVYGFFGLEFKSQFWSFPSGHTTAYMAVALGLSFLFPKHWKPLMILGLVLSLTRVLLANHYLSDVFGTSILLFMFFVSGMSALRQRVVWHKYFE